MNLRMFGLGFCLLALSACNSKKEIQFVSVEPIPVGVSKPIDPFPPGWKPEPIFDVKEPVVPKTIEGKDVSNLPPRTLKGLAKSAARNDDFDKAVIYSYWAAKSHPEELYNLACYTANNGDKDGAIYWLQQAGINTSVIWDEVRQEDDFSALHADVRWIKLGEWLRLCELHHQIDCKPVTSILIPAGYDPKKDQPLNVVIWFHQNRSRPDRILDPKSESFDFQLAANRLNVAFLAISGTNALSKNVFDWADDETENYQRVCEAIEALKSKVQIKPRGIINLGIEEGAGVGLELALKHPELFAGAIALSRTDYFWDHDDLVETKQINSLGVVISYSDKDEVQKELAETDVKLMKRLNAKYIESKSNDESWVVIPSDLNQKLPGWLKFIIEAKNGK